MLVEREERNPILKPDEGHSWEAKAVFNGCPVLKDGKVNFAYRAFSLPHYHTLAQERLSLSEIGIAESDNGIDFYNRRRFIIPEEYWEKFGCEDPKIIEFEGSYYIFYTALSTFPFRVEGIKVGVAVSDDLESIKEKHLVTPFNAKHMSLFPERINGKIWAILTVNTDLPPSEICLVSFDKIEDIWNQDKWNEWYGDYKRYSLPLLLKPEDHMEIGTQPLKTDEGWLVFYSYIRDYKLGMPLFGVEAVLLDLNNPFEIKGRTDAPILTPEEYYEKIGWVENIVFPSGAFLKGNVISLYYGAADTTCCLAYVDKRALIEKMTGAKMLSKLERFKGNPVIEPSEKNKWETKATFNPGAVYLDGKVHLLYRAMSEDNTSVMGYAVSEDGFNIDYRSQEPVYVPRESFEGKMVPGGNSGCEDPRLTEIGDKIYVLYTAFDGKNPPRVALTSISEKDFLKRKWNWSKPVLISPPNIDDKDACIFPEKIKGKYFIIHRSGDDIDISFNSSLDFDGKTWLEEYRWIFPRPGRWDDRKVGIAGPPIKTEEGWVLFYHGVSKADEAYRVGAVLLDKNDPVEILARLDEPLFEPEEDYEKSGQVNDVVFPCGNVLIDNKFFLYYGGGDKVVGVATIDKDELMEALKLNKC